MIWKYDEKAPVLREHFKGYPRTCAYCRTKLERLRKLPEVEIPDARIAIQVTELFACSACGWWKLERNVQAEFGTSHPSGGYWNRRDYGAAGALRSLDLTDLSLPIEEIRAYLIAKYADRFDVHPRTFEEVVRDVMAALGYQARVTSYSNDGGIDVVLDGPNSSSVGVQVKRWRQKIKVEQIRAFLGALMLGGYTRGIFVTTSTFQTGASKIASKAAERAVPIELIDADRFYQALQLSQVNQFDAATFDSVVKEFNSFEALHLTSYDAGGCSNNKTYYVWGETDND
jgi:hypothetical protein